MQTRCFHKADWKGSGDRLDSNASVSFCCRGKKLRAVKKRIVSLFICCFSMLGLDFVSVWLSEHSSTARLKKIFRNLQFSATRTVGLQIIPPENGWYGIGFGGFAPQMALNRIAISNPQQPVNGVNSLTIKN